MGLLGGSRIDSFTITIGVILIVYTILVAGVVATFTDSDFINPYAGASADFDLGKDFASSEVQNMTLGSMADANKFETLSPDRLIYWYDSFLADQVIRCYSFGHNIWDGWFNFELEPTYGYFYYEIEELVDDSGLFAELIFHRGLDLETYVYLYPLAYKETGEDAVYLYDTLLESMDDGNLTVIVATNSTYDNYNIDKAMSVITGFNTDYFPYEIAVLIGGIWWGLLILVVVKLVVG